MSALHSGNPVQESNQFDSNQTKWFGRIEKSSESFWRQPRCAIVPGKARARCQVMAGNNTIHASTHLSRVVIDQDPDAKNILLALTVFIIFASRLLRIQAREGEEKGLSPLGKGGVEPHHCGVFRIGRTGCETVDHGRPRVRKSRQFCAEQGSHVCVARRLNKTSLHVSRIAPPRVFCVP